jgi:hypothetical protein
MPGVTFVAAVVVSAASSSTTPLWVTLLVGLAGALLALVGVVVTLFATSRRERDRSKDETTRQELRMKAEESRLLSTEGRAALAEFLAAATTFQHVGRAWPPRDENAIRNAVADLYLAVARVQITCSVEVASIASTMMPTATLFETYDGASDADQKRGEVMRRFRSRQAALVRAARDELGLNEPNAGEEPSKSWLVTGPDSPPPATKATDGASP